MTPISELAPEMMEISPQEEKAPEGLEEFKQMPWIFNRPEIISISGTSMQQGEKPSGSHTYESKYAISSDDLLKWYEEEATLPPGRYTLALNGSAAITKEGNFTFLIRRSDIKDPSSKANASIGAFYLVGRHELQEGQTRQLNLNQESPMLSALQPPIVEMNGQKKLASLEDIRITPIYNKDGEVEKYIITAQVYAGIAYTKEGRPEHIVQIGISQADAHFKKIDPIRIVLGSNDPDEWQFKNGVFMGKNNQNKPWMLCRSMEEPKEIQVASTSSDNIFEGWQLKGTLPGFWEKFPPQLKDRVIRIGPGTNPVYCPELSGWVAGFHWVMTVKDDRGENVECYLGGLMVLEGDQRGPQPEVRQVNPWLISPFVASHESQKRYRLFSGSAPKEVIFPMSLCQDDNNYYLSAGYQDTSTNLYQISKSELIKSLS